MDIETVTEMHLAASAAVGLFPRIEIDPADAVELCNLAAEALRARPAIITCSVCQESVGVGHRCPLVCHHDGIGKPGCTTCDPRPKSEGGGQ